MEESEKPRVPFGYGYTETQIEESRKTCAYCGHFRVYYTIEDGQFVQEPNGRCALYNAVKEAGERCDRWQCL